MIQSQHLIKKTPEKLLFVGLGEFCIHQLGKNARNSVECMIVRFLLSALETSVKKMFDYIIHSCKSGKISSFILEYNNSLPRTGYTFVVYISPTSL